MWNLRPNDTMDGIASRMAQMEAMIQVLQRKQQQETLPQTTGPGLNLQMERLIKCWFCLKERVNFVDVKGVGKPSVFHSDESKRLRVGRADRRLSDGH